MKVYCTPTFIANISSLEKNKSYQSIFSDVCVYFQDKNIQELHITKDILRTSPGITSLNKYRIPNESMGIGKRGSFRCLCMCNVKTDSVYIDYIYPKSGSEGSDNLTKDGIKTLSKGIVDTINKGDYFEIDIDKKQIKDLKGKVIR